MKSSATGMLYISLADIRKKQDFIARFGPQIRVFSIESCPSKVLEALRFWSKHTHSFCFVIASMSCLWVKICHLGTLLAEWLPTGFFALLLSPSFRRLYQCLQSRRKLLLRAKLKWWEKKKTKNAMKSYWFLLRKIQRQTVNSNQV
jgi:hypothetical protein